MLRTVSAMIDQRTLLNRPMLAADLAWLEQSPWPPQIRELNREYKRAGLPVLNGSFRYSNFSEGPAQALTCHPYRLWEYSSILAHLDEHPRKRTFLDVGGAGSALPYLLARAGHEGLAVDSQRWLVDICNHVAATRGLPLRAMNADITRSDNGLTGTFDLVVCVSVLEHIPPLERLPAIRQLHARTAPGGWLYVTFDFGHYQATEKGPGQSFTEAIADVAPLCAQFEEAGFRFQGNDPRELPADMLQAMTAPAHENVRREQLLTLGVVDGNTPWRSLIGHALRRLGLRRETGRNRYAEHNFFRMFLERKPER